MSQGKNDSPKSFMKSKVGEVLGFKQQSRFGGNKNFNFTKTGGTQPKFNPATFKTQHKG